MGNMEVTYFASRALICAILFPAPSFCELLKGVLYSEHHGQGAHPSGMVELAVGKKIHTLEFGEPLDRRFSDKVCYDIGAVWSVTVQVLKDSGRAMNRVTCTGLVDKHVHDSWLLMRAYLRQLTNNGSASPSEFFSRRWRLSREFQAYQSRAKDFYLSSDVEIGEPGKCLGIMSASSKRIRIGAGDCFIDLQASGYLIFSVAQNVSGKWEIDGIDIK